MKPVQKFSLLSLGSVTAAWWTRRRVIRRLLHLPPATHRWQVERKQIVPMADGVRLAHDHFRPVADEPLPAILIRTPYGRGGSPTGLVKQLIGTIFAERGFHVIVQDVRGTFDSEGEFLPYIDEAADGRYTIDWLAAQPWCNGRIGMYGQSYLGYVQWAAASTRPPQLQAIVPVITQSRLGQLPDHAYPLDLVLRWLVLLDALHDNLALPLWRRMMLSISTDAQNQMLESAFNHLPLRTIDEAVFSRKNRIFQHWLQHPDEGDPYWDEIDHRDQVATAPPAHLIGGWYDIFIDGQIEDYLLQKNAGLEPYLTVGPWHHFDLRSQIMTLGEAVTWLTAFLKDKDYRRDKPVRVYVLGANEWHEYDSWPVAVESRRYYLAGGPNGNGRLQLAAAAPNSLPSTYRYDPADPTPNLGGQLLSAEAGPVDNRPLEAREDVLTFTSVPLQQPLTVIGRPQVTLYVGTTAASADFFVRLCDVDGKGRSINICDGIYRIRPDRDQRRPDGAWCITIPLSPTACRFDSGHRLRLQVSSGAHPRFARNLGVDEPFWQSNKMVAAEQTVCHSLVHQSSIELPLVP